MVSLTREYLLDAYEIRGLSLQQIATEAKTYPNAIRRALKKYNIGLRSKSQAQSLALQTGRHKHPTKGKKRSESSKIKISESMAKVWQRMTDEEREHRIELARKQWQDMSAEEQATFKKLATDAVRVAAVEGSKLEKHILSELRKRQFRVDFHAENLMVKEKLQVDLLLPQNRIAIEIDGPAHFYPIWGEENLAKRLVADNTKTGLLIQSGYLVIRVKCLAKTISKIQERKILSKVLDIINQSTSKFEAKLIEIEMR